MTRNFDYENLNRHFTRAARILEKRFEENAMLVDWSYSIGGNNVLHISAYVSTLKSDYHVYGEGSLAKVRGWEDEDMVIDDILYRIQRAIEENERA